MIKDGITYYYHLNAHGDVTSFTDTNGNVVAEYEYDAWGNILSQSGSMASMNPYRYAGYRYDEETGLYYLMARYYDAEIGRFIARDIIQGFRERPNSLNLYLYAENNPIIFIDPHGNTPYYYPNDNRIVQTATGAMLIYSAYLYTQEVVSDVLEDAIFWAKGKKTAVPSKLKNKDGTVKLPHNSDVWTKNGKKNIQVKIGNWRRQMTVTLGATTGI